MQIKLKDTARRFRKSTKAISPVIATLLMIVIAVAASLVAYAWVMGYLGFTTAKTGKAIQIQSIAMDDTGVVTVYVQNVGDSDVVLSTVYVDGVLNTPTSIEVPAGTPVASLDEAPLVQANTATIEVSGNYTSYGQLTVKVVAEDGSFIELTKTFS